MIRQKLNKLMKTNSEQESFDGCFDLIVLDHRVNYSLKNV